MSIVFACAQMHHHSHQFVQSLLLVGLGVVGFDLEFEWEGHLPDQLGHAFLALVVLESAEMDGEEVGQRLYHAPLLRIDQFSAPVALEFVAAEQSLRFAVVADAVIQ